MLIFNFQRCFRFSLKLNIIFLIVYHIVLIYSICNLKRLKERFNNEPHRVRIYSICEKISRKFGIKRTEKTIEKGGWHFSYLGGIKKIQEKLESFNHTEMNRREFKDEEILKRRIRNKEFVCPNGKVMKLQQLTNSEGKE